MAKKTSALDLALPSRDAKIPAYLWLYNSLRTEILQGRLLPGSRLPVVAPDRIDTDRPDFIIIFPWNLRDEIAAQLERARSWGARFVTAIPELHIW